MTDLPTIAEVASRLVRMSPELMETLFTRAEDGRRLTVDWGEPDAEGFYNPTITAVDDGKAVVDRDSLARALHLHNGHTDRHPDFRGCSWCTPLADAIIEAARRG